MASMRTGRALKFSIQESIQVLGVIADFSGFSVERKVKIQRGRGTKTSILDSIIAGSDPEPRGGEFLGLGGLALIKIKISSENTMIYSAIF